MKNQNLVPSTCQNCRYYKPQGRRGGLCQMMQVPVQSQWESCCFAAKPFTEPWDTLISQDLNYTPEIIQDQVNIKL